MQIIHSLYLSVYMNLIQMQTENARKVMPMKLGLESQDLKPSHSFTAVSLAFVSHVTVQLNLRRMVITAVKLFTPD